MSIQENPVVALLARNFRVGAVIHKYCEFTTPPKNKFLVVASLEPRLLVLTINSEINSFYQRKGLDGFHVLLPFEDHDFLEYDSYTNCVEAHTSFDFSAVRQEVIDDYTNIFKGWLTDECLEAVYHAVKDNLVIRRGHQKEILSSIVMQLPHIQEQ